MNCHCGKPLHYTDPKVKAFVDKLVKEKGEFIKVKAGAGEWYWVQRHYIALHGIKAWELPNLGFKKVEKREGCLI